jgi:hypothetical protein
MLSGRLLADLHLHLRLERSPKDTLRKESMMRNPKFTFLAFGAYVALIAAFAVTSARPAQTQSNGLPPGKDVRVINKETEPVPVSLQTPNPVPVSLQSPNPVPVSLDGTVQIDTSQPIPVVDANAVALEPFQEQKTTPGMTGFETISSTRFDPIPAGKRLVIELVTARSHVSENQRPIVTLTTMQRGKQVEHQIAMMQESVVDGEEFVELLGTHSVRIYADAGTEPFVTLHRYGRLFGGDAEVAFCKMSISGYLVDAP